MLSLSGLFLAFPARFLLSFHVRRSFSDTLAPPLSQCHGWQRRVTPSSAFNHLRLHHRDGSCQVHLQLFFFYVFFFICCCCCLFHCHEGNHFPFVKGDETVSPPELQTVDEQESNLLNLKCWYWDAFKWIQQKFSQLGAISDFGMRFCMRWWEC